jgi:outer membrane protein assembly factor BamA
MMKRGMTAAALLVLLSPALRAQEPTATQPAKRRVSVVVLPVIYYTPETRWAGGAGGLVTFRLGQSGGDKSRPSSLMFAAIYTQNRQFIISLNPEIYLRRESWIFAGKLEVQKFPEYFYGLGNDAPAEGKELYTPNQISLEGSVQKKIWAGQNFYAGLVYRFDHYRFQPFVPEGRLISGMIPGSPGGTISGIGAMARFDSRDNIFFPLKGFYGQFSAIWHGDGLGSDYSYTKIKMDLRAYFPVFRRHVLAIQNVFALASGDAPFMAYPRLGGENIVRGYNASRYRDKVQVAAQVEYRFPLWRRFGMVAFAGLGQVAGRAGDLKLDRFKAAAGFGIRFRIDRQEGTNIRLDFGFGKKSQGQYLSGGEAF